MKGRDRDRGSSHRGSMTMLVNWLAIVFTMVDPAPRITDCTFFVLQVAAALFQRRKVAEGHVIRSAVGANGAK